MLCAWEIVPIFCTTVPKIVRSTRAATRITTAVITIRSVVDSPFILIIWLRAFKNPYGLFWKEGGLKSAFRRLSGFTLIAETP